MVKSRRAVSFFSEYTLSCVQSFKYPLTRRWFVEVVASGRMFLHWLWAVTSMESSVVPASPSGPQMSQDTAPPLTKHSGGISKGSTHQTCHQTYGGRQQKVGSLLTSEKIHFNIWHLQKLFKRYLQLWFRWDMLLLLWMGPLHTRGWMWFYISCWTISPSENVN